MTVTAAQKLHIVKGEYVKLLQQVQADERARDNSLSSASALSSLLATLEATRTSTLQEISTMEQEILLIEADLSRDSQDPNEEGLSEEEKNLRLAKAQAASLRESRASLTNLLRDLASERDSLSLTLNELRNLAAGLTRQCAELAESLDGAQHDALLDQRTPAQRREDERFRRSFDLPENEAILATYTCVFLLLPGRITLSQGYLCFVTDIGTNKRKVKLADIAKIRKTRFVGLISNAIEITLEGGAGSFTFSNIFRRQALIDDMVKIAASSNHQITID